MDDPLAKLGRDLDDLLNKWAAETGGKWTQRVFWSLIRMEPQEGWARQRRGPQMKIELTITDGNRLDELAEAYYPEDMLPT